MKYALNKNEYPHSKNEFWRFADIGSFGEKNVSTFLVDKNIEAKDSTLLDGLGLDRKSFLNLELSKNGLLGAESLQVQEASFKAGIETKLEGLALENARCETLKLGNDKILIEVDCSLSFSPSALNIEVQEAADAQIFILQEAKEKSFVDCLWNIDLKKNAKLKITFLNNTAKDSLLFAKATFNMGENSKLDLYSMQEGLSASRLEYYFDIASKGASVNASCFMKNEADCLHNLVSSQMHKEGDTSSNLTLRNVLAKNAKASFSGYVKIEKDAQNTSAKQSCKTLLLDKTAKINALPILEIEANDVECAHGCAVSMPDEEQIFYLKARGLSESEAKALIAEGFVNFEKALA